MLYFDIDIALNFCLCIFQKMLHSDTASTNTQILSPLPGKMDVSLQMDEISVPSFDEGLHLNKNICLKFEDMGSSSGV